MSQQKIFNIKNEELINFFENEKMGYDCSYTKDLEQSIKKSGFTDPIEVAKISNKMDDKLKGDRECGKYMIISGHRRRAAGVKVGMKEFPCIIREGLTDYVKYRRAVLEANIHRGKGGSPLQIAKELNAWKEQLKLEKHKGDNRKYLAEIMGMSQGTIQRYGSLLKMDEKAQELVDKGYLSLSNVTKLGGMKENEQKEVLKVFDEYVEEQNTELEGDEKYTLLTKDVVENIIDMYKEFGCKNYNSVKEMSRVEETVGDVGVITDSGEVEEVHSAETENETESEIGPMTYTDNEDAKDEILNRHIHMMFDIKSTRDKVIKAIRGANRAKSMQEYLAPNGYSGCGSSEYERTFRGFSSGLPLGLKGLGCQDFTYSEFTDAFVEAYKEEYYKNYTEEDEKADKFKKEFEKIVLKLTDMLENDEYNVKYTKDEINGIFEKMRICKDMLIDKLSDLEQDPNCTKKVGTVA